MEGLRVAPPSTTCAPSASNSDFSPSPAATATTPVRAGARRRSRASICSRMSPTSRRWTSPACSNTATATSGSSVWTCTFSVAWSPTTSTESPISSRRLTKERGVEPLSGDDEVRAVAKAAVEVVGARLPRRLVMRDLRDRVELAAQPRDDPRQDHHQPVRPGVDHAGLGQHVELLGGALDRLLPRPGGHREHLGQQLVLLGVARLGGEALAVHVRQVLRGRVRHLADHGQHGSLSRVTHGFVGGVGGARERRRHQHRVDQLPGAAGQLLGGAADDLAQDHARVAARAHQRRPGDGVDDLLASALCRSAARRGRPARSSRRAWSAPCCPRCRRRRPGTRSGR